MFAFCLDERIKILNIDDGPPMGGSTLQCQLIKQLGKQLSDKWISEY